MKNVDKTEFPSDLEGKHWAFAYQEHENHQSVYLVYLGDQEYLRTTDVKELKAVKDLIFLTRERVEGLGMFVPQKGLRSLTDEERAQLT